MCRRRRGCPRQRQLRPPRNRRQSRPWKCLRRRAPRCWPRLFLRGAGLTRAGRNRVPFGLDAEGIEMVPPSPGSLPPREPRLSLAVAWASGSPREVHGARIVWGACRDAAPRSRLGAQLNAHAADSAQGSAPNRGSQVTTHIVRFSRLAWAGGMREGPLSMPYACLSSSSTLRAALHPQGQPHSPAPVSPLACRVMHPRGLGARCFSPSGRRLH